MHRTIESPRPDDAVDGTFAGGSRARRGWTLFVACAGVSLVIASMVGLNTALADIAVATSATQTQLTWIVDCYTLLLACLLLPAGAIGDRYGRRSALLVGLAIFAVVSFSPLVFDSPVEIIAARGPHWPCCSVSSNSEGGHHFSTFGCSSTHTSAAERQRSR